MADWIITTAVGTGEKGFARRWRTGGRGVAERAVRRRVRRAPAISISRTRSTTASAASMPRAASSPRSPATATRGYSGDGGPATAAALNEPYGIVVDRAGNLYIADRLNRRVRRIDAATGIITTLAGTGEAAYGGDGGPAARAGLGRAERARLRPRRDGCSTSPMSPTTGCGSSIWRRGTIATFAGTGAAEHSGDGGPAAAAGTFGARAVKVGADGTVYILERQGSSLRAVDPADRDHRDDRRHHRARLWRRRRPGARGGVRRAEGDGDRPRRQPADRRYREPRDPPDRPPGGTVSSLAGGRQGPGGDGGPAGAAGLDRPHGAVVGPDGAIYIGDTNNHRIRKVVRG